MYNPQAYDYGIVGSLDKEGMDKRLQDIREQVAKYSENNSSIRDSDIASALDAVGVKDPVYGEGVVQPEYIKTDHTPVLRDVHPAIMKSYNKKQDYLDAYIKSLNVAPSQVEQGFDQAPVVGTDEAVPEVVDGVAEAFGLKLPTLGTESKTIKEMVEGSIQKKNPSFDGNDFQDFLTKAKATKVQYITDKGTRDTDIPVDPGKAKLYNKLLDAGMSEDDMFKAAQYAGLTNIRTGKKGKSDFKQMLNIFENDFMVPQETTEDVITGMDEAEELFGQKFGMKDYNAALGYENQDKKYIKKFLKDYAAAGGKVSKKVRALFPGVSF